MPIIDDLRRKFKGNGIIYDDKGGWGQPIRDVTRVEKDSKNRIKRYYVEGIGWVSKSRALAMAAKGQIDNAVIVRPKRGSPYLRSIPDKSRSNFSDMVV